MATNIASLNINLFARIDRLTSGLRAGERAVERHAAKIKAIGAKVKRSLSALTGGLAAGLSAGALVRQVQQASELGDKLGKVSDQLGVSTEQLAGLEFAGALAGLEMDNLVKSLAKLSSQSARAARGQGEPLAAFKALGLSAKELVRLSPDKQLLEVADAIARVENVSKRLDLARTLFGEEDGQRILSLIGSGSGPVLAQIARAQELGLGISRDQAAVYERQNDSITRLRFAWRGVTNEIALGTAPAIDLLAQGIEKMQPLVRDLVKGIMSIPREIAGAALKATLLIANLDKLAAGVGLNPLQQADPSNFVDVLNELKGVDRLLDTILPATIDAINSTPDAPPGTMLTGDHDDDAAERELTNAIRELERGIREFNIRGASLFEIGRSLRDVSFGLRNAIPSTGGRF